MPSLTNYRACLPAIMVGLMLGAAGSRAQVTVQIGANFTASTYSVNSQALPPDANGAMGPGRFVEFINGEFAVYNPTNGASVLRKTDLKFWSDAGLIISPDSAVSDPRVIYDPATQRWFASQVDFNTSASDPTTMANDFLLAVSLTSSPTGPWKGFLFQADQDNGYFADFPTLGLDSNAVYLSGDMYSSNYPMGAELISIPKADLVATTPSIARMHSFGVLDYDLVGQVLQPAICLDGSVAGSVMAMGDIGSDSSYYSNLMCFAVQNAGGTNPTLTAVSDLTVLPYMVPDNADLGVPQFAALQPDATTTLQANDPRLSAKVYAVGGVLYGVHSTLFNNRIAVRWYRVRASDRVLLEQGTISDPNLDLYMPCIAANQYGVVMICFNGSGANDYISAYACAGQTVNGHTTFGNKILLQAGQDVYHDLNEVLAILLGDPPVLSRWGDYGALSVDPADPSKFWVIQMFAEPSDPSFDSGIWATQVTQLITTAPNTTPPSLAIARSGTNVVLSWPSSAGNYQLYETTRLLRAVWTPVTQTTVTNGATISVTVPHTGAAVFFRLKQ